MDTKAFQKLNYGLYLISSRSGDETAGCVVNTFTQATSSPARVTVTINKDNHTAKVIQESGVFAAAVLTQESTMELIGTFGFHSSLDTDKFKDFQTAEDENHIPFVTETTAARFCCKVLDTMDAGSHIVFLAEVQNAEVLGGSEPMTYAYYHQVKKGQTPPKASSYTPESAPRGYRCKVCGYILEADSVPDDFVCPICGRGKEALEKITG